jgi:hypothetical protein
MHVAAAVTEAAAVAISVEVAIMEDSLEVAITHQVEFRTMEDLHTMVIVEGMSEELTGGMEADTEGGMEADTEGGMEADTVGIITEAMHQEGPYSELFLVE